MKKSDDQYEVTNQIDQLLDEDGLEDNSNTEWEQELEDDEPTPKARRSVKNSRADEEEEEEEDEEYEDEDEEEKASFIATRNGKIVVAASVVALGVLSFAGYNKFLAPGQSDAEMEQNATSSLEAVPPQGMESEQGLAPVAPLPAEIAVPAAKEDAVSAPVSSAVISIAPVVVPEVVQPTHDEVIEKAVAEALSAQKKEMSMMIQTSLNSSIKSLQLSLSENADHAEVKEEQLRAEIEKEFKDKAAQEAAAKASQQKQAQESELGEQAKVRAVELAKLKLNRAQVPGFQVVNQTKDGKMAVIKTPTGQIHVYFSGEKIRLPGFGVKAVTGIEDAGRMVLIDSNLYIDETVIAPVVKKESAKEATAKREDHVVASVKPKSKRTSAQTGVKGWKLNGVFPDGYLVQTPQGEWVTVNVGGTIPGIGKVNGIDQNGNLAVGGLVIKKSD